MVIYPVIFTATNDKKNTYLVYIPDIDGKTEGHGIQDAYKMTRDYMGCIFLDKTDDDLPAPTDIEKINLSDSPFADCGKSFVTLVDFDLDAYRRMMNKRAVRKNVSIPAWLDKAAEDAHINISRVLQDALMDKLNIHQ